MKITALAIAMLMPSIITAITAGYLALNDQSGWGWFLFAAILMSQIRVHEDLK